MGFGPDIQATNNAATPLAADFVRYLQGQLSPTATNGPLQQGAMGVDRSRLGLGGGMFGGAARHFLGRNQGGSGGIPATGDFGSGVGSAGQAATSGIQSFIQAAQQGVEAGGVDPGTQALIEAITARSGVVADRQAADLREAYGAAGNRFGTALARGEGQLRSDIALGADQIIAQTLANRQSQNEANLIQSLALLQQQGALNIQPFLTALGIGLPQAENVVSPGVGSQILSGVTNAAESIPLAFA